jgi:hypothetical protein
VVIGGSALTALGLGTDRSWWMLYASWG